MNDSGQRKLVKTLCGKKGQGTQYVSTGNAMDLVFRTDGSGEQTGFSIKYIDTVKLPTTTPSQATVGKYPFFFSITQTTI